MIPKVPAVSRCDLDTSRTRMWWPRLSRVNTGVAFPQHALTNPTNRKHRSISKTNHVLYGRSTASIDFHNIISRCVLFIKFTNSKVP